MISNDRFQFPPVEFRVHPFWFWNGEMEEEEIARQIGEMKDKGVGGIFICARQGIGPALFIAGMVRPGEVCRSNRAAGRFERMAVRRIPVS
ncbi:hypothetical protein ACHHV8_21890 [Paenibacillus sp. TAB 01]|uniref:hypothetical protein n=1 Tax=Paenibacillus sp. TAB 01 TaxID=3368988 RepID=UPI003752088D